MKALNDRNTIDARFTRAHLPSQWPLMAGEWLFRNESAGGMRAAVAGAARNTIALCASIACCMLVAGISIVLVTLGRTTPQLTGVALLALFFVYASFGLSMMARRPLGAFWISALIERSSDPAPGAGLDRASRRARRPHAASRSLPAPDKANSV